MRMSRRRFVGVSASIGATGCLHEGFDPREDGSTGDPDGLSEQEGGGCGSAENGGDDVGEGDQTPADEDQGDSEEQPEPLVADGESWTSFSYDELNTGYLEVESPVEFAEPQSLDLSTASVSSPTVADGRAYLGGVDGALYCVEGDEVSWRHGAEARVAASPAVRDGEVFYADDGGFRLRVGR